MQRPVDKLIFPSAITRILRHFFILFPSSDYFSIMCAIDYAIVKHSEVQLRSRQSDSTAPPMASDSEDEDDDDDDDDDASNDADEDVSSTDEMST